MTNNMTIKQWANKTATAKTKCFKAFQQCRLSEREAGTNIATCRLSKSKIVKSLGKLSKNNKSANAVKAKVKNLTASSGRHIRAVSTDCSKMEAKVIIFTVKLGQNPEADVASETSYITGIKLAAGQCSSLATSIKPYVTTLDTIIATIKSKIAILQAELKKITGSTASSSEIAAAAPTTTAKATTAKTTTAKATTAKATTAKATTKKATTKKATTKKSTTKKGSTVSTTKKASG
jgi:hypothetical protein